MGPGGRKLLAVLAGGVVLAGGGVTTLASWQDQTYDKTPLTLSSFDLQQNTGSGWVDADTEASAGLLTLTVQGAVGSLVPGGAVTAWVGLRTAPGSLAGQVVLEGATVASDPRGLLPNLTYQAVRGVSRTDCAAGVLAGGTELVAAGTALTAAVPASTAFRLDADAGTEVGMCLKLSLKTGVARTFGGASVTPVWKFNAESAG